MKLTEEQLNVLNYIVVDGQAWADNAKEEHMLAKVARHKQSYLDAKLSLGAEYKDRKQQDALYIKNEQAKFDNVSWKVKRRREYPKVSELIVALYDTDDKAAIEKRRADVKAKYPKPE